MNLPIHLTKSSLLAFAVFWLIIGSTHFDWLAIPFVLFSFIPIFIGVSAVIMVSILTPFWIIPNPKTNAQDIFNNYFPYYAIIVFGGCLLLMIITDFNLFSTAFFTSFYITTCQSWVWLTKEKMHEKI